MFWDELSKYQNNIAFIDTKNEITIAYKKLIEDSELIADRILQNGSLCLLLCNNDYASVLSYVALLKTDYAIMLLNHDISHDFLLGIIERYVPDIVISADERKLESYNTEKLKFGNFNLFLHKKTKKTELQRTITKLLLSTSGSTGSSKFVRLSSENINANATSIAKYLKINESERAITSLPINYSFGLSVINSHLLAGASIILTDETIIQKGFWEYFNKYKSTTFSGVPYTYQILHRLKLAEMELPTLKYFTQAGGHLVHTTKKYFYDLAIKNSYEFFVMYGQTEATARITYVPFEYLGNKIDSIGIPIPDGKLSISLENDNNNEKELGELIYEGPNVMLGYSEVREDILKDDELNGKLFTGDIGYKDSDGYFYVKGRKKRFIKIYGNRINLDDVERIIEINYKVQCAVTGDDDKLLIVIEKAAEEKLKSIVSEVATLLSVHPSSIKAKQVDLIPISSNSKKNYQKIKETF